MTNKQLIGFLQGGEAPDHKVIIAGHDSEGNEIRFEPYSVRWESGQVVIDAELEDK